MKYLISILFSISLSLVVGQNHYTTFEKPNNDNYHNVFWCESSQELYALSEKGFLYSLNTTKHKAEKQVQLCTGKSVNAFCANDAIYYTCAEKIMQYKAGKISPLGAHTYEITSLSYDPYTQQYATGGIDDDVKIGKAHLSIKTFDGHKRNVVSVAISPEGKWVASSSKDNSVQIHEISSGTQVKKLQSAQLVAQHLQFNHSANLLYMVVNKEIVAVNTTNWAKKQAYTTTHSEVNNISLSPDDNYLAVVGNLPQIEIINLTNSTKTILKLAEKAKSVQFLKEGKQLASVLANGSIALFDISHLNIQEKAYPIQATPTKLSIVDVQLIERFENGIIESKDQAYVKVKIKNEGKNKAYNVRLHSHNEQSIKGFSFKDSINIGILKPQETKTIKIPLDIESKHLESGKTNLSISVLASHFKTITSTPIKIQTKGSGNLAYSVVSAPIFKTSGNQVKRNLPITMVYKVKNIGIESAKNINISYELPDNVYATNQLKTQKSIIASKETIIDSLIFYIDKKYEQNQVEIKLNIAGASSAQNQYIYNITLGQSFKPNKVKTEEDKLEDIDNKPTGTQPNLPERFSVDTDIPNNNYKNDYRFALVIGNETYTDYNTNVLFANNDARIFKRYLINLFGFEEDNIIFLNNATALEIKEAVNKMQQYIKATNGKAEVVFYYSGASYVDKFFKDKYLLPTDLRTSALDSYFSLQNLLDQLYDYNPASLTSFIDDTRLFESRLKPLNQGEVARSIYVGNKMSLLSANTGNQSSAGSQQFKHGLFTYYLLKKWKQTKGQISWELLCNYTKEQVKLASIKLKIKPQIVNCK